MTTDAPTDQKDALPKGQPSEEKKEPSAPPETFTREQAEKLADEKHSVLDKRIAELERADSKKTKALEVAEQRAKDAEARDTERQDARDAKELEDANEEQLPIIQQKQRLRKERETFKKQQVEASQNRVEFEAEKVSHKEELEAAQATRLETDIWAIGKKHEVDPAWLKSLGITDLEQLDKVAKGASEKKPFEPDSGKTTGGLTDADFKRDFASGKLPVSKENMDRYNKLVQTY